MTLIERSNIKSLINFDADKDLNQGVVHCSNGKVVVTGKNSPSCQTFEGKNGSQFLDVSLEWSPIRPICHNSGCVSYDTNANLPTGPYRVAKTD